MKQNNLWWLFHNSFCCSSSLIFYVLISCWLFWINKDIYIVESPEFNVTLIGILVSVFFYEVHAHNFLSIKTQNSATSFGMHIKCVIAYEVQVSMVDINNNFYKKDIINCNDICRCRALSHVKNRTHIRIEVSVLQANSIFLTMCSKWKHPQIS
jgi:hypothetical protein